MFENITPEQAGISSSHVLNFIKELDQNGLFTHSIIMARGDKIFSEVYYRPFDKDFKYRMYSVTKSFVGVAVGLAIEDGLLSLDDKFVKFFPEYLNENTTDYLREATSRLVENSEMGIYGYDSFGYGYQIWQAPEGGFAFVGMGDQFAICGRYVRYPRLCNP